jgi:Fe-S cluster biosynthesis and repair protein YggX
MALNVFLPVKDHLVLLRIQMSSVILRKNDLYKAINLMLPTYGRVKNGKLAKHLESIEATRDKSSPIYQTFLVNYNDKDTYEFLNNYPFKYEIQVLVTKHTSQPNLAKFFNQLYDETKFNYYDTMVSMIGDDMVFKTQGWNTKILEEMNKHGGVGIVHCDDDYVQKEKMAVQIFTSRYYVSLTELPFMCELFPVDVIDRIWTEVTKQLGHKWYLPDVVISHEHSNKVPKDKRDSTYLRLKQYQFLSFRNKDKVNGYIQQMITNIGKNI